MFVLAWAYSACCCQLFAAGYQCVLHVHNLAMECQITKMTAEIDKKTGKPSIKPPAFMKAGGIMICKLMTEETIAIEVWGNAPTALRLPMPMCFCAQSFKDCAPLGRFTLRDEGKTIGIGKILRIKDAK